MVLDHVKIEWYFMIIPFLTKNAKIFMSTLAFSLFAPGSIQNPFVHWKILCESSTETYPKRYDTYALRSLHIFRPFTRILWSGTTYIQLGVFVKRLGDRFIAEIYLYVPVSTSSPVFSRRHCLSLQNTPRKSGRVYWIYFGVLL